MSKQRGEGEYQHTKTYQSGFAQATYKFTSGSSKPISNPYLAGTPSYKAFRAGIQAASRQHNASESPPQD